MRKLLFSFLLALLVPMAAGAQEKEPYAVLSDDNTVLTFYYDDQKAARGGMDVGPFDEVNFPSWYGQRGRITIVVFDDSFTDCTSLTSTAYWFYGLWYLSRIIGIDYLKTDNVTSMKSMFFECSSLTSLDVTGFKTDNVTNMYGMFLGCSSLTSLDVTGFKTDNVTNMYGMFQGCSSLTSLDVTGFKTDNVTNMSWMFRECSGLTSLDLTGFKTDNVTYMDFMFSYCRGLTSLDLSGFKTDNVKDMRSMFYGCSGLTSLDVSAFKTGKVTNMSWMFYGCSGLTSLDLTGFKTYNVDDMRSMFDGCTGLTTIYVGDEWSTVTIRSYWGQDMFTNCTNLVGGAGTRWDEIHTDYTYARIDGGSDNPGYFTAKADEGTQTWAEGDLNHDGKVDAADVVVLVNMILNQK